ncbi:MAG: aspartate-semialdehyde dehydrogenase [Gammaproteobacteria bacterium]|nr:aspartate-semialdehyde dehydrogenase [Gammaproteobacteria bacterium]NNF62074.1 aspartate-semialdehyde dehydrogenase [Gammaproteobacteria bacterium]NNM20685.1 aspartate-semialdehyde dehydrogenase [Gammaproteobacteria bacterium]
MKENIVVAVAGATGAVGEAMLDLLIRRRFPASSVHALASARSVGRQVGFGNRTLDVKNLATFDFSEVDIALFSAGASVSEEHATRAAAEGCVVIDNTSCFRYDDDVPLVVPEVNADAIGRFRERNLIANPNCSTIQMLVALKPIYDKAGIERINVATYQAVSGAGRSAIEQLASQTACLMNGRPLDDKKEQIAFNVRPQIDTFLDNGYTREEMKMVWETRKILEDDSIMVNPTAARVPVFYGHSEAVHIETREKLSAAEARQLLENAPGIEVMDQRAADGYPTAALHAAGNDPVYVGRIRDDISHERGLALWVVADNVRKGAALNSVQIAELLVKDHL